jgi:polyhydroxyalkanoate synthesis regulator phasin
MEGKRLFEELAEDGENVRDRANGKVHELKSKAKDKIKKTIVKLREIVHLEKNDNTQDLSLQIEELSKAVKALSAEIYIALTASSSLHFLLRHGDEEYDGIQEN